MGEPDGTEGINETRSNMLAQCHSRVHDGNVVIAAEDIILSSELLVHTVLLRSESDSDERPFSNRHCSNGTVVDVVWVEWPNGDLSLL